VSGAPGEPRALRLLLLVTGLGLIVLALLYNELLVGRLDPTPPLAEATVAAIRRAQLVLFGSGILLIACSRLARHPRIRAAAARPGVVNAVLASLFLLTPILVLEVTLRPFAGLRQKEFTTIFERDDSLGWKLRPGAEDVWGGTRVRVNTKGLRGPEVAHEKPVGTRRLLFLGDSVTFGLGLEYEDTFPALVAARLGDAGGLPVEAVNAGVGGYSPWQQHLYLVEEGIRYAPDLVVVSFVLNDVTEKFDLARFGGAGEGWQLARNASSQLGKWLERLASRSSIVYFVRELGARLRFGADVKEGARERETLDVRALVETPERPDVVRAWEVTLGNLGEIVDFCAERELPLLLVVVPFRFQLEEEGGGAPQAVVGAFARDRSVPILDLLPRFAAALAASGGSPDDYFMDDVHLGPAGSALVADAIAESLRTRGVLEERAGPVNP
jgi:lysophospholipase L1-like esterase